MMSKPAKDTDTQEIVAIAKKIKDYKDAVKNDSLVTMGSMKSCQELFEKHKSLVTEMKDGMIKDIQKNELSQETANYCLKSIDKITQMIKQFSNEKLHHYYAKIGALNATEACFKTIEAHKNEIELKANAWLPGVQMPTETSQVAEASQSDEVTQNKTEDTKSEEIRPDSEKTKMGKKLKDIRARKKKINS